MFGKDYFKRTQYSARIIHDKALEWIDKQDAQHPFVGFLTYTLPHAELAQPKDSILRTIRNSSLMIRLGADGKIQDTILLFIPTLSLQA